MIEPTQLAFLPFQNERAFQDWLRYHGEWHKAIFEAAVRQNFLAYKCYPLFDAPELEEWAYFHNLEHQNIAFSLHFPSPLDLSGFDTDDQLEWETWLGAHASIHADIRTALGFQ